MDSDILRHTGVRMLLRTNSRENQGSKGKERGRGIWAGGRSSLGGGMTARRAGVQALGRTASESLCGLGLGLHVCRTRGFD